jgi:hypothetical protein
MMKRFLSSLWVFWIVVLGGATVLHAQVNRPPKIEHGAVTVALTGQPLMIRARITDDSGAVQSATLYYAVSKDAAPFSVRMQPAGTAVYVGSIPDSILQGVPELTYYIEAVDSAGVTSETAWFSVKVQKSSGKAPAPASSGTDSSERPRWITPALIAGGAAVVVGGVMIGLNSSDDGDSSDSTVPATGSYAGTATTCYLPPGGSTACSVGPATIEIDDQNVVRSNDLRPGTPMQGRLSGSGFILTAEVKDSDQSGEIQYVGTVADGRIAGTIQGSVTTPSGVGTYSGAFSASRK